MNKIAKNDTIFKLKMDKNNPQYFGKYNDAKFFYHNQVFL